MGADCKSVGESLHRFESCTCHEFSPISELGSIPRCRSQRGNRPQIFRSIPAQGLGHSVEVVRNGSVRGRRSTRLHGEPGTQRQPDGKSHPKAGYRCTQSARTRREERLARHLLTGVARHARSSGVVCGNARGRVVLCVMMSSDWGLSSSTWLFRSACLSRCFTFEHSRVSLTFRSSAHLVC